MELSFKCDLTWADLDGRSNTRRHCGRCDHPVYNLSGMTRQKAARFLKRHEGETVCVRYATRDGAILHNGDPLAQLRDQRQGVRKLVAAALAVQVAFIAISDDPSEFYLDPFLSLADSLKGEPVQPKYEMMGNMAVVSEVNF